VSVNVTFETNVGLTLNTKSSCIYADHVADVFIMFIFIELAAIVIQLDKSFLESKVIFLIMVSNVSCFDVLIKINPKNGS